MDQNKQTHILFLPYPSQGHINPMLQFAKRLSSHNLLTTLATTRFILSTTQPEPSPVSIESISDGFDDGGFFKCSSVSSYINQLESSGSESLSNLLNSLKSNNKPVQVLVYDAFLPWALEVGKRFGLVCAAFFTQSCAVDITYWHVWEGRIKFPVTEPVGGLTGLPRLEPRDLPSFLAEPAPGKYPAYLELVLNQYINLEKADVVLINSFYELEREEFDGMRTSWRTKSIGPTIPSTYMDNRIASDSHYGFNLFTPDSNTYITWLDSKPESSVIYVSFGSMAALTSNQTTELAFALINSNKNFLWVVRSSELTKLPKDFPPSNGLVVTWCNQLDVLSHKAVGCFVTHCGWNSTIEGIGLGVPMVAMPQWTDQTMNAKYIEDVWGVGVRVELDKETGILKREELERCINEVMEGQRSEEIRKNSAKWREIAREVVSEGGSSDKSIGEFVAEYCLL